ncbi:hypothetical protein [Hyphomicrobium sp.]|uniref:hypothetical protein n=1 Tax=Hyphomicrobium sp. TaxID=82 RepID=UPI00356B1705
MPALEEIQLGHIKKQEQERIQEEGKQRRNNDAYRNDEPSRPPNSGTMDQFIPHAAEDEMANKKSPDAELPQPPREQIAVQAHSEVQQSTKNQTLPEAEPTGTRNDRHTPQDNDFGNLILYPDHEQPMPGRYDELRQLGQPEQAKPTHTQAIAEPEHKPAAITQSELHIDAAKGDQEIRQKLTPEALDTMMAHYDQLAHRYDIYTDDAQAKKQDELDVKHGVSRNTDGKAQQEANLNERQYDPAEHLRLAEQVHVTAGYYAVRLELIDPAESARCQQDSQQANKLALLIHADLAAAREDVNPQKLVERQNQDAKSKVREAASNGQGLTDAEKASASPEAKNQLDGRDKSDKERGSEKLSKVDEALLASMRKDAGKDTGRGGGGRGR